MHSEYIRSKDQLDMAQADKVLDEIYLASQNTYYAGYPSRTTIELHFPRGLDLINTTTVDTPSGIRTELVFYYDTGNGRNSLVRLFPFNATTSLSANDGFRKILIKAELDNYVNITEAPR